MISTNPTQIIVNHSDVPIIRRLLIRNSTNQDFIVKVVPSSKQYINIDSSRFLVRSKNYFTLNVTVNTNQIPLLETNAHKLNIYARPFSVGNFKNLKEWITNDGIETVKQLVRCLSIKVSKEFSARDTVVEVPGDCQSIESVQWASQSHASHPLDRDTKTAVTLDADTQTARSIHPSDNKYSPNSNQDTLFSQIIEYVMDLPTLNISV